MFTLYRQPSVGLRMLLCLAAIILFWFFSGGKYVRASSGSDDIVLPVIKPMKNMTVSEVARRTIINGLPISAHEFTSSDSIDKIAAHYLREWEKAGFEKPLSEITDMSIALHTQGGNFIYTIQARQYQEAPFVRGRLMVSTVPTAVKTVTTTDFPLMSGNVVNSKMTNHDEGKEEETLFILSSKGLDQNYAFLIERLESEGWVLEKKLPEWLDPAKGRMISGQRQSSLVQITLTYSDQPAQKGTAILVHWIH